MKKPNILILMVDEERYPVVYESEALKVWRNKYLKGQTFLKTHGFEFKNHYAASTACAPSRASIYTGQYPSLHGVTQTPGVAKEDFDSDMIWMDKNTVPTFGDYFKLNGYKTFWKGKWHASQADIINPGPGHPSYLSYDINTGIPSGLGEERYLNANKLGGFGFDGWVGPEPFGRLPVNSGSSSTKLVSGRDTIFADEAIELIEELENEGGEEPWLIVTSFVNPHDITLYGEDSKLSGDFNFDIDSSVPLVDRAPTSEEDLSLKPSCQESYRKVYQKALQPTIDSMDYRRLYYSLQLQADREMQRVLDKMVKSKFYEDTIIIFTADHGDLGGAHGGLFQKWYQAYEETVHVPLIFHNPILFKEYNSTEAITSHIDLLPTLLEIGKINTNESLIELEKSHTQVFKPVGRDLSPLMFGECICEEFKEAIYFMTDDDVTKGQHQQSVDGESYESVIEPSSVETVIVYLKECDGGKKVKWKFSRYFNNADLWTSPNEEDKNLEKILKDVDCEVDIYSINRNSSGEEFEMYNLNEDPIEERNLMNYCHCDERLKKQADFLYALLIEQRNKKRLAPRGE